MLWLCGVTVRRILSTAPLRLSFFLFFRPLFSRLLFPFYGAPLPPCSSCPRARRSRKVSTRVLSSDSFCVNADCCLFCILLVNFPGGVCCKVCSWIAEGGERIHSCQQWVYHLVSAILDIILLTISAIKAACVLLMKTMYIILEIQNVNMGPVNK